MTVVKSRRMAGLAIKACILSFLFVAAYFVPITAIVHAWMSNEDYSYGFLILPVSLYLLWEKRRTIKAAAMKNAWSVLPVLIFFVLLSIYGILGSSGNIARPVIPILIILFAAFCFGLDLVRRLMLPLGLLVFTVPVPEVIERTLGLYLKSLSSKLGGVIIGWFNIPVHISGNIIDLGAMQLQVVDACSGLRYIFPLIALGVLYAYFFERVFWKRMVCVVATIPIAVLINTVRIGLTGILATSYGAKAAEGFFHGFSGWLLFVAAFAGLFLLGRCLAWLPTGGKGGASDRMSPLHGPESPAATIGNLNPAYFTSIGILVVVMALSMSTGILPPVKIQGGIQSFPLQFGTWVGEPDQIDPEMIEKSGAEAAFSAQYRNLNTRPVSLYMGYRSSAFQANENFFHSPTVCLPSSGWHIERSGIRMISDVPMFGRLTVHEMVVEKMGARQLVYYWFQTKSEATDNKDRHRFDLTLHALRHDNTHALFIRPMTEIAPGESPADAERRADRFVREMMGTLQHFLKNRQIAATT